MLIDKLVRIFESAKIPESVKMHDTHLNNLNSILKSSKTVSDDIKKITPELKSLKEISDFRTFLTSLTKVYDMKYKLKLPKEIESFAELKMSDLKKIDRIHNDTDKKFLMDLYFNNEDFYRYVPVDANDLANKIANNIKGFGDSAKSVESHLKLIAGRNNKSSKLKYIMTATAVIGVSTTAFLHTYSKVMTELNENAGCIRSEQNVKCKVAAATCQSNINSHISRTLPKCLKYTSSISNNACEGWTTFTDQSICRMCDTTANPTSRQYLRNYDDDPGATYKCNEPANMGDILTEVLAETKEDAFSIFDTTFYFLKHIKYYLYYVIVCITGLVLLYFCNKFRNIYHSIRSFV